MIRLWQGDQGQGQQGLLEGGGRLGSSPSGRLQRAVPSEGTGERPPFSLWLSGCY